MFIPIIGSVLGGLFNTIHRGLNTSEDNFREDLGRFLEESNKSGPFAGQFPEKLREQIIHVLWKQPQSDIGKKLNAMINLGLIPPELVPQIGQLAEKNGVSHNNLDPAKLGEEMEESEVRATIQGYFPKEFEEIDREKAQMESMEVEMDSSIGALDGLLGGMGLSDDMGQPKQQTPTAWNSIAG